MTRDDSSDPQEPEYALAPMRAVVGFAVEGVCDECGDEPVITAKHDDKWLCQPCLHKAGVLVFFGGHI